LDTKPLLAPRVNTMSCSRSPPAATHRAWLGDQNRWLAVARTVPRCSPSPTVISTRFFWPCPTMVARVGERADREPCAASGLANLCGGLPLALRIVTRTTRVAASLVPGHSGRGTRRRVCGTGRAQRARPGSQCARDVLVVLPVPAYASEVATIRIRPRPATALPATTRRRSETAAVAPTGICRQTTNKAAAQKISIPN
jgi:hypothetical protein